MYCLKVGKFSGVVHPTHEMQLHLNLGVEMAVTTVPHGMHQHHPSSFRFS